MNATNENRNTLINADSTQFIASVKASIGSIDFKEEINERAAGE